MPNSDPQFAWLVTLAAIVQVVVLFVFPRWLRAPLDRKTIELSRFGKAVTNDMRENLGPCCSILEWYAWMFCTTPDRIWRVFQVSGLVMSLGFGIAGIVLLSRST